MRKKPHYRLCFHCWGKGHGPTVITIPRGWALAGKLGFWTCLYCLGEGYIEKE